MDEMQTKCTACGKNCRFVLCDACHAVAPIADEPIAASDDTPSQINGYGLPASFAGVHRY